MVQKFKTLADVVALAEFAHRNQFDKAGMPYIEHPRRVMQNVQAQGAMPYVQMSAILHDVTEDTAFTCDMLLNLGVPEAAVEIVKLLDRDYSAKQFHLLNAGRDVATERVNGRYWYMSLGPDAEDEFYYSQIKDNPGALQVKLADIGDNLQPWRLVYLPEETQKRLRVKYYKAIEQLTGKYPSRPV
jgi:(p)ppGpp synthase/HD superfamily hydrolase